MNLDLGTIYMIGTIILTLISIIAAIVFFFIYKKISSLEIRLHFVDASKSGEYDEIVKKIRKLRNCDKIIIVCSVVFYVVFMLFFLTIELSPKHIDEEKIIQTYNVKKVTTSRIIFDEKNTLFDKMNIMKSEDGKKNIVEKVQQKYSITMGNIKFHNDRELYNVYLEHDIYVRFKDSDVIWETEDE